MINRELARRGYDSLNLHPVLGQSTRLIGKNERRGTKRLHCRQVLYDCVVCSHSQHATRKCQCGNDRQTFWDRRYGERYRRFHHHKDGLPGIDTGRSHCGGKHECEQDQMTGEERQLSLQWGFATLGPLDKIGDTSDFGGLSCTGNNGHSATAHDMRASEQHGAPIGEHSQFGIDIDTFVYREGFTGECRLVNA